MVMKESKVDAEPNKGEKKRNEKKNQFNPIQSAPQCNGFNFSKKKQVTIYLL